MISRNFVFAVLVLLVFGCFGVLFGQHIQISSPTDDTQIREDLHKFTDVYRIVEQNYAEQVDPSKAIFDGAIPGMLQTLDPHSTFFDPKAYAALKEEQSGKYYGVGMSIAPRGSKIIVVAPFAGAPAYKAGIRPGDVIAAIDGKSTENLTADKVADMVRGPLGTKVDLSILRPGVTQPLHYALTRAEIPRDSVDVHFMIKPGIGYMHVAQFNETTDDEIQKSMSDFGDVQGLILDMRQDPGGLLTQAVGVAGEFLPKGSVIVSQRGRSSPEQVYRAMRGNNDKDYPIVVIVDRGTASAAEIVTGALQDHDRALVIGQNTFGKGLVQTVFPLSDETALALTTAKYYTPSGRLIQRNYEGVSLYDYYYNVNDHADPNAPREVKKTDTGRLVYGGDGITPDVKIAAPKPNKFQETLLLHYVFFDFAQNYLSDHKITKNFQVDEPVMQSFRSYLTSKNVPFTEADLQQNRDWVSSKIATEVLTDAFGLQSGQQEQAASDPEVAQALALLPQARILEQTAQNLRLKKSQTAEARH